MGILKQSLVGGWLNLQKGVNMTNYDDTYMKKDESIIKLRIIFTEDSTRDTEATWNGRIFTGEHDVDFDTIYHELKEQGYKEAQMLRGRYSGITFEEV